jgi:F0F1-type ATP synthase membrane subunit a
MKARDVVLGALIAAAMITAVGVLVGLVVSPVAYGVQSRARSFVPLFAMIVNLITHLSALGLVALMLRRATGGRAAALRQAFSFVLGYALVVFLTTVIGQIGIYGVRGVASHLNIPLLLLNVTVYFPVSVILLVIALTLAGNKGEV